MPKYNEYAKYIYDHINNVKKAWEIVKISYINMLDSSSLNELNLDDITNDINNHDASKFTSDEFYAYAAKYFPSENDKFNSYLVEEAFNQAWEHHYTHNKHHPEYWIIDNLSTIDMPKYAIIEMSCDWIAMDIKNNETDYLKYYYKSKNNMVDNCLYFNNVALSLLSEKILYNILSSATEYIKKS